MSSVPVVRRGPTAARRRGAIGALAVLGATIVTFAVVQAFDGPTTTLVDEVDGRTWLTTSGADGPVLVLANGISGLVEGQVSGLDLRSTDIDFAGSDARHTLLRTPSEAVLLADGRQTAATLGIADGARSVLAAAGIVTAGDDAHLRRITGDAAVDEPEVLALDGRPVPGTAPIVDREGRAWVLVERADGGRRVQAVMADGTVGDAHDAEDALDLVTVDGQPMLRTSTSIRPVHGGDGLAVPGADGAVPDVADHTRGAWAVADGGQVVVTGGVAGTFDMGSTVTALAVWHGRMWAATGGGLATVGDGGLRWIDGFSGRARVFADGGRLWFVTPDVAAAIDRDQHVTVFTLASVDLSLCVGDCSASDATRVLDDLPTTTEAPDEAVPTTTTPPISPPAVLPSLPSTTTTTTTEPPVTTPPTTPPPAVTVAATAPPAAPDPTVTVAVTAPPIADTAAPETIPITLPPLTEPPPPPPPRASPPRTTPATDPPPTEPSATTEPPLPPGQIVLGVEGGTGRAAATYGFDGVGVQCAGASGDHTNGELSWAGVASGSELVELDLSGGAGRGTREFSALPPGELTVTFRACGEIGSATAVIEPDGSRPSVGALTFDPAAPSAGDTVTVSASVDTPPGWLCASVTWVVDGVSAGGRCRGSAVTRELDDLTEGAHQVQVIVSFTRLIESAEGTASGSITVTATTTPDSSPTTVEDSSTTTVEDSTTTTVDDSTTTTVDDSTTTTVDESTTTTVDDSTTTTTTVPPTDPPPPSDPTTPPA